MCYCRYAPPPGPPGYVISFHNTEWNVPCIFNRGLLGFADLSAHTDILLATDFHLLPLPELLAGKFDYLCQAMHIFAPYSM